MKTFEQFLKLKLEAPMASYQGQQYSGMPGADDDFSEPEDPGQPSMQQQSIGDMNKSDSIDDAFADPEQYPKMFSDLYQRIAALEQQLGS